MVFPAEKGVIKEFKSGAEDNLEELIEARKDFMGKLEEEYNIPIRELQGRIVGVLAQAEVFPIDQIQEIWFSSVVFKDADCGNEDYDSEDKGVCVRMGDRDSSQWLLLSKRLPKGAVELEGFGGFDSGELEFSQLSKKGKVKKTSLESDNSVIEEEFGKLVEASGAEGISEQNIFDTGVFGFRSSVEAGLTDLVYVAMASPIFPLTLRPEIQEAMEANHFPRQKTDILEDALHSLEEGGTDEFFGEFIERGASSVLSDIEEMFQASE